MTPLINACVIKNGIRIDLKHSANVHLAFTVAYSGDYWPKLMIRSFPASCSLLHLWLYRLISSNETISRWSQQLFLLARPSLPQCPLLCCHGDAVSSHCNLLQTLMCPCSPSLPLSICLSHMQCLPLSLSLSRLCRCKFSSCVLALCLCSELCILTRHLHVFPSR